MSETLPTNASGSFEFQNRLQLIGRFELFRFRSSISHHSCCELSNMKLLRALNLSRP